MTAAAPSGVVTFLFTDVEGSTRRWETDAEGMRAALAAHDEVLRKGIEAHGGFLFKHTGDGVCAALSPERPAPHSEVAAILPGRSRIACSLRTEIARTHSKGEDRTYPLAANIPTAHGFRRTLPGARRRTARRSAGVDR